MGWQEMMIHLKRNWPAKILSLLAAIVMWFFIMRDQNPVMEVSYTVPVQVQNLAANYIIEDAPQYVRVTLSGPRDTIINLKSENLKAYIDASGVSTGQNNVTIHFNRYRIRFDFNYAHPRWWIKVDGYIILSRRNP